MNNMETQIYNKKCFMCGKTFKKEDRLRGHLIPRCLYPVDNLTIYIHKECEERINKIYVSQQKRFHDERISNILKQTILELEIKLKELSKGNVSSMEEHSKPIISDNSCSIQEQSDLNKIGKRGISFDEAIERLKPIHKEFTYYRDFYRVPKRARKNMILSAMLFQDFGIKVPMGKIKVNGKYMKAKTYNFVSLMEKEAYLCGVIDTLKFAKLKPMEAKEQVTLCK